MTASNNMLMARRILTGFFAATLLLLDSSFAFAPRPLLSQRATTATIFAPSTTTLFTAASPTNSTPAAKVKLPTPDLCLHPPRKVALLVEPTPFTHVSGYANRFQEMLKFMHKAGDSFNILTTDALTPKKDLPTSFMNYSITHTQGFTFPLYKQITLTVDLPEMKGAHMLEDRRPDLIHATSPGFFIFAAMFYARVLQIPLVVSYHTHLPTYGTELDVARFVSLFDRSSNTSPLLYSSLIQAKIISNSFLTLTKSFGY